MQRYNIFNQLHKGLQALLYDTALMIQQTDFTRSQEGMLTLEKISTMLHLFHEHAALEDHHFFPAIRLLDAAAMHTLELDHKSEKAHAQRLKGILSVYEQAVSTAEMLDAAGAMSLAYRDFMIVTLQHMSKEEDILNQLLWCRYTDAEIMCIEQELLAHIAPEEMALYNQWMLRGLNNREIITWLRAVKKTAVGTAFQVLLAGAERELSVLRWQKIQEVLSEGALVA